MFYRITLLFIAMQLLHTVLADNKKQIACDHFYSLDNQLHVTIIMGTRQWEKLVGIQRRREFQPPRFLRETLLTRHDVRFLTGLTRFAQRTVHVCEKRASGDAERPSC